MRSQLRLRNRYGRDYTGLTEVSESETYPDRPANVLPVLSDVAASVAAGETVRIRPLNTAVDLDGVVPSTLYVSSAPSAGTARVAPDGTIFFDAHEPVTEEVITFKYRVQDRRGGLSVAKTATITVAAV